MICTSMSQSILEARARFFYKRGWKLVIGWACEICLESKQARQAEKQEILL